MTAKSVCLRLGEHAPLASHAMPLILEHLQLSKGIIHH